MKPPACSRLLLLGVLVFALAAPGLVVLSQTQQAQTQQMQAQQPEPYHKTDLTKPAFTHHQPKVPLAAKPTPASTGLTGLAIYPASVAIISPRFTQRLVIEATFADGHQEDVTSKARLVSSQPGTALVDKDAFVHPEANGETTVSASYQGQKATAQVEVKDLTQPFEWSFRNQVLPVMTKMGCNSGPCHGAAAGKSGFKLTLRGYDPDIDYDTLTHQALARRTNLLEPARSLILLKPTLTIPHGGGQRFAVGSPEYQVIAGWIAAGMPPPKQSDARIVSVDVLPQQASLTPGAEQQLVVMAKFSDGHSEDVTRWAKFTSGDEAVATVDDNGHVTMHGCGEAPVTVWYLSHVTFARMRIPYPYQIAQSVYSSAPHHNYIDNYILDHLKALHIPPSPMASDSEFIRRAYLDAAGMLPKPAEVERFLNDKSPDKHARLIEELMTRSEFVDYWAYKWSDLLLLTSNRLSNEGMWSYYDWIRESVKANKPWDQFVYQIITATGNTRENGAANYWVIHRDPTDIAENMTAAFMGINMACAHCHNHPLAKWTQKDYYGMANLFARVRLKTGEPGEIRSGVGVVFRDVTVYQGTSGDYTDDRFTRPLPPKPLEAPALSPDSQVSRRAYFAKWLTAPENHYFARALVNRVWRNFMGRGLVEPVDDLRDTNPPTNSELLDALTKDFVAHHFDVDNLIRTIMESAAYQTTSRPLKENADDDQFYSHYLIRRLPAEVILDAVSQVTQVPEKFDGYPEGTRALQLPDTAVKNYFLTAFGRPLRQQTRESERTSVPTITQALHAFNGDTLNDKLRARGGTIDMLLKLGMPDERIIEYLYLSALSRYPTESERSGLAAGLQKAETQRTPEVTDPHRAAIVDMSWALLTNQEFMFDH